MLLTTQDAERLRDYAHALIRRCPSVDVADALLLIPVGRQLHRLYENACNYGLTERQEAREASLRRKADEIAEGFGARIYHQTDPRGWSLYVLFPNDVPEGKSDESCYTYGVGVPLL